MKACGAILLLAAAGCWAIQLAGAASLPAACLVYLPMSALTALAYRLDKARARGGGRRVPERTLHLLELGGGWPGALWAREQYRHKTRDRAFRAWFWAIGLVHLLGWIAWLGR